MFNSKPVDFYSSKIELNTLIDRFEDTNGKMTSSELSEQIKTIEKKILDLNKLGLESQDTYEKDKRLGMTRVITQRFNNIKKQIDQYTLDYYFIKQNYELFVDNIEDYIRLCDLEKKSYLEIII